MASECDFCGNELPGGCYGMAAKYKECRVKAPKTLAWKIGLAIWTDLSDRGGIKHELSRCEPHIQAEIVKTMGEIALKVVRSENDGKAK